MSGTDLNDTLSTGKAITVMIITKTNSTSHSAEHVTIDGAVVTEEWLCGAAPTNGGQTGYDVYTYNIIKQGSDNFLCLANVVNYN